MLFDAFERGRYSTDASIYQVEPIGIVRAKSVADIQAVLTLAREEGVTVLPRGGGTSQCGQTVGESIVVDCARWFNDQMAWTSKTAASVCGPAWSWGNSTRRWRSTSCSSPSTPPRPAGPRWAAWRRTIPLARARSNTG